MEPFVITIARGFGSGGKTIGTQVAKDFGIPCYEQQLLEMASDYSGINETLFAEVDEKLRGSLIIKRLTQVPYSNVLKPSDHDFVSDTNLFNIQAEIIRTLAKTQSCVIIGKCADFILRDYPNVVSIYIEAPRGACVASIRDKMEVTEKQAAKLIVKTDKYRSDYYKFYTGGQDWRSPVNYDLIINSHRVGRDKCAKVIEAYTRFKLGVEKPKAQAEEIK